MEKHWQEDGILDPGGKLVSLPKTILVPCEYQFQESPSSLTEGKSYVLFLEAMGANLYHPLDPASTHRIKEGKASDFGMNSDPTPEFGGRVIPVADFKKGSSGTAAKAELGGTEEGKPCPQQATR